jgi:hypothetical protein
MQSKKPSTRGNQSFTKIVPLKDGETCTSLKRHYRNCAREVVGYLDKKAQQDPEQERFAFPSIPTIVKRCNKYRKKKAPYARRQVNYVLAILRQQRVIADVERVRFGSLKRGWLVASHDTVTVVENNCCDLQGQRHWERQIETEQDATGTWRLKKIGPVIWRGAVQGTVQPTVQGTVQGKPATVQGTVQGGACTIPPQMTGTKTTCFTAPPPSRGQSWKSNRASAQPDGTGAENQTSQTEKGNSNGKTGSGGGSSRTTDQKPETIAQHFGRGSVDMDEITEGEFEENDQTEYFDESDLKTLLQYCDEVIQEWRDRLYLGSKTNGDIMAAAMVRYTKKYRQDVPKYWYPIAKRLRESPPQQNFVVDEFADLGDYFRSKNPKCPNCQIHHPPGPCGMRK